MDNDLQPSTKHFFLKLTRYILVGICLFSLSLAVGMVGYHYIEGFSWIDSYLEAAMILSGMGPVKALNTFAGKLFAGTYAIYCCLVFITTLALISAPIIHHVFHKFHIEGK